MRVACGAFVVASSALAISVGAQNVGGTTPPPMSHQHHSNVDADSLTDFANTARAGVEVFRDRSVAMAAGYRRIGMDFPSMGEHWVNTTVLYEGVFDVAKPALLSYAMIDGRPVLTGAVYALLLSPGEHPPAVPGGSGQWHDHSGTLGEESSVPVHHGGMSDSSASRLLVLHAWVGVPNPDGLFEADNWALPYVRAGVPVPNPMSKSAARALSLLSGAKAYYVSLSTVAGAQSGVVGPVLDSCASTVAPIAARMRAADSTAPSDIAALEAAWRSAMIAIGRQAGAAVVARMNGGELVR